MGTTSTKLMTFAGFEKLPDTAGGRYELRHGELVLVPPPKWGHFMCQRLVRDLLDKAAGDRGFAEIEMGFRAGGEHNYRSVDVGFLTRERESAIPARGYLAGAPDLVVEVLSPSNTAAEIRDKKKLCLENGSREFWVLDMDQREAEVSTPDGHTITYKSGQSIPLFFAPGVEIAVDDIFLTTT